MIAFAAATVALAQSDEVRRLLPEAASLPADGWTELVRQTRTPEELSRRGLYTLTAAVLTLPMHPDIELDVVPEAEVSPKEFRLAIGKDLATCLQKDFIRSVTFEGSGDAATGHIESEIPRFGKISAEYRALREGKSWRVVEFRLPKAGVVSRRDGQGQWRLEWATPRASTLSLVYSFGMVRLFGRKVFDATDGSWETLEKIFSERPGASLIISGTGTGWNWGLLRAILRRAKAAKTVRIRTAGGYWAVSSEAGGEPAPIYLCCSRTLVDSHAADRPKHDAELAKLSRHPSFAEETFLGSPHSEGKFVILHHPLSDDATLAADRKAVAQFVRAYRGGTGVRLEPDDPVSCEHLLLVATAFERAGIKDVRFPPP